LDYLIHRNSRKHNALFSRRDWTFHTMPISDCYRLVPVFGDAFRWITSKATDSIDIRRYQSKLLDLIVSFTRLFGNIWAREMNDRVGRIERAHRDYCLKFDKLNEVDSEMMAKCLSGGGKGGKGKGKKGKLSQTHNLRCSVISTLDKPNTHRIREFAIEQSLFWDHPVWVGELSLERTHQRVKRALKQTNCKEEQILAMNGLRFNDWQARLCSVLQIDVQPVRVHYREAIALLYGRNSGVFDDQVAYANAQDRAWTVLDPSSIFMKELQLQGQSIYNKHGLMCVTSSTYFRCLVDGPATTVHTKFDFKKDGDKVCTAVGIDRSSFSSPSSFSHRVLQCCNCKMRTRTHVAGDLILNEGKIWRILFFCLQGSTSEEAETTAIMQEYKKDNANAMNDSYSVKTPEVFSKQVLDGNTTFIATYPDCTSAGCSFTREGKVLHRPGFESCTVIAKGETEMYPPRAG